MRPAKKQALVYSRRMLHPDPGAVVGVLCLCFHFKQEMAGIFRARGDPLATLDPVLKAGLLSHAHAFCPPLHEIMHAAGTIRRVVWNGQIMTAGQRGELHKLQAILE